MKIWLFAGIGLAVSLLLVMFLAPFVSDKPDGLEYVGEKKGFLEKTEGKEIPKTAPLADYGVGGVTSEHTSTIIAGVIGIFVCLGAGLAAGYVLKARRKKTDEARASR